MYVSPHLPQYWRLKWAAIKIPAPHSALGHSRLNRWILPLSSTCRIYTTRKRQQSVSRKKKELRLCQSVVSTLPCSTWAQPAWPSSSCALSSWEWYSSSFCVSFPLPAVSAPDARSTPSGCCNHWESGHLPTASQRISSVVDRVVYLHKVGMGPFPLGATIPFLVAIPSLSWIFVFTLSIVSLGST